MDQGKFFVGAMRLTDVLLRKIIMDAYASYTIDTSVHSHNYIYYCVLRVWSTAVDFFVLPAINDAKSNEGS